MTAKLEELDALVKAATPGELAEKLASWLTSYAYGLRICDEPTHGNDEGLMQAASLLRAQAHANAELWEACRFVARVRLFDELSPERAASIDANEIAEMLDECVLRARAALGSPPDA